MNKYDNMLKLVEKFGTPLYILYEKKIIESCKLFCEILKKYFGEKSLALYACKALSCKYLCKLINEQNLGLDVSSGGELFTAQVAGFPMRKIMFHGNNKTKDELEMAINSNVFRIVVDNIFELKKIIKLSEIHKKDINILIRIRPNVDASTHNSIKTGDKNSKFGMSFDEVIFSIEKILSQPFVKLKGFHAHIGSQIFDLKSFKKLSEIMIDFYIKMKKQFDLNLEDLNLGGGFGVRYLDDLPEFDLNECICRVSKIIKSKCKNNNIEVPFVYFEPGRQIIAKTGVTLYTVGCVKRNDRNIHVIVDGSMNDNPRFALYGSRYLVENISKKNCDEKYETVCLSGRCCESGDIICQGCSIKRPDVGDVLCIYYTGAYNFSMSANYNKFCKPPVVLVKENNKFLEIVKRQTYGDLISCEI